MGIVRTISIAFVLVLAGVPAHAIEVEQVVSPGGIEAWLVEDHSNPIISVDFAFRGGAALDPEGKTGLAYMVSGLLDEGAGELDSAAFQGKLEELSIRLGFDANGDSFRGSLQTLTENKGTAFELLRLALRAPRFDTEAVERIRSQVLAQLARDAEDPHTIAGLAIRKLWFPDHPYGRPVRGTPETVKALTTDDFQRFVDDRFGRDNLVIGVVGDIDKSELARLLDETFLTLSAQSTPFELVETTPGGAGETLVIEKSVPQSVVNFGHSGPSRHDPDFYAALVVDYILGGGSFASRLYEEVREERGLAYSVYTYLAPFKASALWAGGVGTQNARVAESLAIIRDEWRRMAEQGPTEKELKDAKTFLTGSFPLRLTSGERIAGMLVDIQLDELGVDYLDHRNGLIEAVSLEDARRVAGEFLHPEKLAVVVVGQPQGIAPPQPAAAHERSDSSSP